MADSAGMSIQPDEVADVSRQLDGLAARAQRVLADEAPNLTVTASGRTQALVTVKPSDIRSVGDNDLVTVRQTESRPRVREA